MAVLTVIQMRRGTASEWTTANPVLSVGEPGYETDTSKFKLGNGSTTWNSLKYIGDDKAALVHNHNVAQLTDSTSLGRSVLTAPDQATARTAIGAGTSNLLLGRTSSTAMPGDTTFSYTDITGTIPTAALPPLAINETTPVASQSAMLSLVAQRGDVAIRTDTNETYILASDSPATLADWKKIMASGQVTSVAGRTGVVVLTKTDVGLSNVDNTSDSSKPISTLTQNALNGKANTTHAHQSIDILTIDGGTP